LQELSKDVKPEKMLNRMTEVELELEGVEKETNSG
jgi:hypothetical protein